MNNKDIVKGTIYDRGIAELNGQKKYMSLVAMIVASDVPLIPPNKNEIIVMGTAELSGEVNKLKKYNWPYPPGDISNGIISASEFSPDDLDPL